MAITAITSITTTAVTSTTGEMSFTWGPLGHPHAAIFDT